MIDLSGSIPAATSYSGTPTYASTPAVTPAASGPTAQDQISGGGAGSTIGGAIGTVAGAYFGGPAGAGIGGALGSAAGGALTGGASSTNTGPTRTDQYSTQSASSPFDASNWTVNFDSPGASGSSTTPTAAVAKILPLVIIVGGLLIGVILWKKL
jgi:hypothetical protein